MIKSQVFRYRESNIHYHVVDLLGGDKHFWRVFRKDDDGDKLLAFGFEKTPLMGFVRCHEKLPELAKNGRFSEETHPRL